MLGLGWKYLEGSIGDGGMTAGISRDARAMLVYRLAASAAGKYRGPIVPGSFRVRDVSRIESNGNRGFRC